MPATEDPSVLGIFPLAETYQPPAPAPTPVQKAEDPKQVAAEIHAFSQLASAVCAPSSGRDSLPEYILFGIIALLAAAWPIWALFHVVTRYR